MKKSLLLFGIILILVSTTFAQKRILLELLPGQEKTMTSESDTLWLLKRNDVLKLMSKAEDGKALGDISSQQKDIITNLEKQIVIKDTIISKHKALVESYETEKTASGTYVKELQTKLDQKNGEIRKLKMQKRLMGLGAGAAIVVAIIGFVF